MPQIFVRLFRNEENNQVVHFPLLEIDESAAVEKAKDLLTARFNSERNVRKKPTVAVVYSVEDDGARVDLRRFHQWPDRVEEAPLMPPATGRISRSN